MTVKMKYGIIPVLHLGLGREKRASREWSERAFRLTDSLAPYTGEGTPLWCRRGTENESGRERVL